MGKIYSKINNPPDYNKVKEFFTEAATNYKYPEA